MLQKTKNTKSKISTHPLKEAIIIFKLPSIDVQSIKLAICSEVKWSTPVPLQSERKKNGSLHGNIDTTNEKGGDIF